MSTKNYNSFPEAPEVLVDLEGKVPLIRKRQTLHQIYENECDVPTGVFGSAEVVTSEEVMA